jgi:hypothetical protein
VFEHDELGAWYQAVVPGGFLGRVDPWRPHMNSVGTESWFRRSVMP